MLPVFAGFLAFGAILGNRIVHAISPGCFAGPDSPAVVAVLLLFLLFLLVGGVCAVVAVKGSDRTKIAVIAEAVMAAVAMGAAVPVLSATMFC